VAEIVRYINTASSGGDGTTNAEAGATAAYATAVAAEAAEAAAFNGNFLSLTCSTGTGTAADTAAVTFNGSTFASAADTMVIKAAAGHVALVDGIDTNRYRLTATVAIQDDYVTLLGLQIPTVDDVCVDISSVGATNQITIKNCYIQATSGSSGYRCVTMNDATLDLNIINTVLFAGYYGVRAFDAGTVNIYNSIIAGCEVGVDESNSAVVNAYDSGVFNNTDDFLNVAGTISFCMSDDGDGTDAVAILDGDIDKEYVDASTGDFTPVAGGNGVDGGTNDPGSGLYSAGMDGVSYTTDSWSIGVVQFVAAGGGVAPIAMYYRMSQ